MGRCVQHEEARSSAACTAFEGRIIVGGGFNGGDLNTVEAYDHIADEWSRMPSMTRRTSAHHLVAARNKLFSIGKWYRDFDVYDSTCKKFVRIQPSPHWFICGAVTVKNKVLAFHGDSSKFSSYDVDKEEWSTESCIPTANSVNKFTVIPKLNLS